MTAREIARQIAQKLSEDLYAGSYSPAQSAADLYGDEGIEAIEMIMAALANVGDDLETSDGD